MYRKKIQRPKGKDGQKEKVKRLTRKETFRGRTKGKWKRDQKKHTKIAPKGDLSGKRKLGGP